jgi:hypothetical protein
LPVSFQNLIDQKDAVSLMSTRFSVAAPPEEVPEVYRV